MKLSPTLTALINTAGSRNEPTPAPAKIQDIFGKFERETTARKLSLWPWLTISTATVMTMNSPKSMAVLFEYITRSKSLSERVAIAEFMREIGLRCTGINGLPRTINMLNAFRRSLPEEVASLLRNTTSRELDVSDVESIQSAGRTLWERVHSPADTVLESKLKAAHPDLPIFTINYLYGGLFSNPNSRAATRIDRIATSLFAIACLRAQQGVGLQLLGHVTGLKNSSEDGSWRSVTHIGPADAIEWLVSDEGCIWVLKTIDELVEALSDDQTSMDATIKARI